MQRAGVTGNVQEPPAGRVIGVDHQAYVAVAAGETAPRLSSKTTSGGCPTVTPRPTPAVPEVGRRGNETPKSERAGHIAGPISHRLRNPGCWPEAHNAPVTASSHKGDGTIMVSHPMDDLKALPNEDRRKAARGLVGRSGPLICAGSRPSWRLRTNSARISPISRPMTRSGTAKIPQPSRKWRRRDEPRPERRCRQGADPRPVERADGRGRGSVTGPFSERPNCDRPAPSPTGSPATLSRRRVARHQGRESGR